MALKKVTANNITLVVSERWAHRFARCKMRVAPNGDLLIKKPSYNGHVFRWQKVEELLPYFAAFSWLSGIDGRSGRRASV